MASIIPNAFDIYRAAGCEPVTGFSPYHFFNWRDAPFTLFLKGKEMQGCPGLALQEVMFLEHFRDYIKPQRVLVIGNAFGWSTIVLALVFPDAKILALDIDKSGVDFTNELIAQNKLSARAMVAKSPEGVAGAVRAELGGAVDFCLIDAMHDNESLLADFAAAKAVAAPNACYVLHDVINWHMIEAVRQIESRHTLKSILLTRTASGMALVYSTLSPEFDSYLNCFSDPPERYHQLRQFYLTNFADPITPFMAGYRPPVR